ncbi:MAG: adenine deaminase [Proteobacteria bacterium]|nr:adenine deaminase [Pseudomonadota bacterium]MBU1649153.1 adenine deaminase [Pseudomonadota bacterium]
MSNHFIIEGTIADVVNGQFFKGGFEVNHGRITRIYNKDDVPDQFILPGLIDAHIHIESSMLVPSEFARLAVIHGTVATVSDPHEIANVLGLDGIDFMIRNSQEVPFKFFFGAPSCVPATSFESSGTHLGPEEIAALLGRKEIKYLSEMMNFPGVINNDKEVMAKIDIAQEQKKPIDGHAPGLSGEQLRKYIASGITTDHECFTLEEAREKIAYGMKVQIREGSAAKNFNTLIPLIQENSKNIMFCSDDKHPDELLEGHINLMIRRAIQLGYDPLQILKVCTLNPVRHYQLDVGLLQQGDPADFIIVDNFNDFNIAATYINGVAVSRNAHCLFSTEKGDTPNIFNASPLSMGDIIVPALAGTIKIIRALDGQLITKQEFGEAKIKDNLVVSDTERDILKIVVMNRYEDSRPAVAFIRGFGLRKGALASTVAHDSHNVIAVGTSDREIVNAVNMLIESKGGIVVVDGEEQLHLPLPVAGIMTNQNGQEVATIYRQLNAAAKKLGTPLHAPFMTLSFMALLVIPELKLSDQGLFDGSQFDFTSLFKSHTPLTP